MNAEDEKDDRVMKDMVKRWTKIVEACNGLSQVEARTLLLNAISYIQNEAVVKIPPQAPTQFKHMFKSIIEMIKKQRGDGKEVQ